MTSLGDPKCHHQNTIRSAIRLPQRFLTGRVSLLMRHFTFHHTLRGLRNAPVVTTVTILSLASATTG